jgi:outer membrane lipoprotein-sorting protein
MKRLLFMSISMFVVINFSRAHAQYEDANQILKTVLAKQNRINDYQVNIEIELDVDFINMPVKHAVMYYKHPQRIKFKSDEFIMLPKKGFNYSLRNILKRDFTSIFTGYEYIDQRRHYIIKVIPTKKRSDIVLSTIWLDTELFVISKVENNTRSEGSYTIDFTYGAQSDVLPSQMKITFEMGHFNIPLKFIGKPIEIDEKELKKGERKTGVVYLRFSDYKINVGLEDDFFEDEVWSPD